MVIEKPNVKTNDPPQCHNCQEYGHTRNYYRHVSRYVKCGDNRLTAECTKDRNLPAKCALYSGDHTASYKGNPNSKMLI